MATIVLKGVTINFPFEPYDLQKEYMEKVLECLQNERNGVLESPTGTGKTLSLLCSSLAWLEMKKAQVQAQRNIAKFGEQCEYVEELNKELDQLAGNSKFGRSLCGIPTIIYASRTHSQLSQAMQELKRTSYRYMRACVLGSREQLCIHPEVVKLENNSLKTIMCQLKVKTRTCHFANGVERNKESTLITEASIMDIEDLVTLGNSNRFCPYYMSKELVKTADIIFMPYNYLLDISIRKSLGLRLSDCIVILDEAHNVEKMCEESSSFQLKSSDIALAIEEVTSVMKKMSEEAVDFDDTPKDFTAEDLCHLKEAFLDLEKEVDNIDLKLGGLTLNGTYMLDMFEKVGITTNNVQQATTLINKLIEYMSTVAEGPFARRGNGLQIIETIMRIVFVGGTGPDFRQKVDECCKVHVEFEEIKKWKADNWLSKATSKAGGKILNYWCFSPGFGMNMFMAQGIKCLILTSGTLAPLKPLISELEIPIEVHLENPHIVTGEQVCVEIVSQGPDGEVLNCNYQNRDNPKYMSSLGMAVLNITKVVPGGILIFFPSYPIMQKCQQHWQENGVWGNIAKQKAIYVEPRDKDSFNQAMREYYKKINDPVLKGAIFMGVCRGKVSEGLDFADINGRAVIITGLPYPPVKDPRIVLKRQYLDGRNQKDKEFLRGDAWYSLEASRAVNQAIGRVIRHKDDYGVILLFDTRFNNLAVRNQMSLWLRHHTKVASNFGKLMRDMKIFFMTAESKFPTKLSSVRRVTSAEFEKPTTKNSNFNFSTSSLQPSMPSKSLAGEIKIHDPINPAKRKKISLIPNSSRSTNSIADTSTKDYIIMVKKNLPDSYFKEFVDTMQAYKDTEDLDQLISNLDCIFKDKYHLRYLVLGLESYIKPHHKQLFKAYCDKNS